MTKKLNLRFLGRRAGEYDELPPPPAPQTDATGTASIQQNDLLQRACRIQTAKTIQQRTERVARSQASTADYFYLAMYDDSLNQDTQQNYFALATQAGHAGACVELLKMPNISDEALAPIIHDKLRTNYNRV